jgi:branched-chain amino acid transport system permease protein
MLSLAHASVAGIAAYTSAVLTTNFNWPFAPAIAVGVALGAGIGLLLGLLTARMNLLVSSLVTLGFGETVSVVAYNVDYLGGANSFSGIPLYTTLPVALAAFLLTAYVVWRYSGSRLGLAAAAVRDNPLAASANGIDVRWIRALTFSLGAAIAAFAGAISAHYTLVVNPADLGFWPSFYIQVYVIFGGSYAMLGPIAGAFLLTPLTQLLRFAGPYRFAAYGLIILLVIMLRPQGLIARVPTGVQPRLLGIPRRGKRTLEGSAASQSAPRTSGGARVG